MVETSPPSNKQIKQQQSSAIAVKVATTTARQKAILRCESKKKTGNERKMARGTRIIP
jgi:hypothetical protein